MLTFQIVGRWFRGTTQFINKLLDSSILYYLLVTRQDMHSSLDNARLPAFRRH